MVSEYGIIFITGVIIMNNQKDKKVPLPLKVHESVFDEVDQTAKEKGIPRSDEAEYRLKHYATPLLRRSLWLSFRMMPTRSMKNSNLISPKKLSNYRRRS